MYFIVVDRSLDALSDNSDLSYNSLSGAVPDLAFFTSLKSL